MRLGLLPLLLGQTRKSQSKQDWRRGHSIDQEAVFKFEKKFEAQV